jgi:hypothetical protein
MQFRIISICTALAALLSLGGCALLPSESPDPSFTEIREIRKSDFPKFLSGITYAGNDLYYSVADREGKMYPLVIRLGKDTQLPTKPRFKESVTLEGASDLEAVAWDPLRKTVWAADEADASIREFDPTTGRLLGNLDLPQVFRKFRPNLAFEALAISPDGLELWTANEEALSCDGATANSEGGSLVRLCRFRRADANDPWKIDGMWAYETDPTDGQAYKGFLASGVSGLMVAPDGAVYALEREFSQTLLPGFRARIYKLDISTAQKVSETPFSEKKPERTVGKELVFGKATGIAMYEDCCFGPVLKDGRLVVLCSDGDDRVAHAFLYLSAP